MSDPNPIVAEGGTVRGPKRLKGFVRKAINRILRPWIKQLDGRLSSVMARLDQADRHTDDLFRKADGLSSHLQGLGEAHSALEARFESRVVQIAAMANSFPGIDSRMDALEEQLNAFQALHWDHVAMAHRLAAIEDVLAATGDVAATTIRDGAERALLPFPGLDESEEAKSRVC